MCSPLARLLSSRANGTFGFLSAALPNNGFETIAFDHSLHSAQISSFSPPLFFLHGEQMIDGRLYRRRTESNESSRFRTICARFYYQFRESPRKKINHARDKLSLKIILARHTSLVGTNARKNKKNRLPSYIDWNFLVSEIEIDKT